MRPHCRRLVERARPRIGCRDPGQTRPSGDWLSPGIALACRENLEASSLAALEAYLRLPQDAFHQPALAPPESVIPARAVGVRATHRLGARSPRNRGGTRPDRRTGR